MAKNFFQDMVRTKNLRKEISNKIPVRIEKDNDVEPPHSSGEAEVWSPSVASKVIRKLDMMATEQGYKRPRYSIWLVAIGSLAVLFFAVSFLFSKATITINPKIKDTAFNQNLSASEAPDTGGLSFDLVVISGDENKTVTGGEKENVAIKAKGTVIIYNTFSSAIQRLDIDTRLEGSNGKLYKTQKQITVPGMNGQTPGSVEVGIYGAEVGEEYNSGPLDFQIFGFKGTPKYSKFYARSKGEITGGLKGTVNVVSEDKKTLIVNELKTTLQAKLFEKAVDLTPEGFILFKDAMFLNIDSENFDFQSSQAGEVPVSVKGTFYGFLFNEKELTQKIAQVAVPDLGESEVYISNIHDLTFSLLNKGSSIGDVKNISFNLSGKPKIVWTFDRDKLIDELMGKSKKDFNQIVSQYSNFESANVSLRPFWKISFPLDRDDIKVTVNYPIQ